MSGRFYGGNVVESLLGFLGGAGAGATVGSIVEGESALRTSHSWSQALDAVKEGAIVLGVHGTDPTVKRAYGVSSRGDCHGRRDGRRRESAARS